MSGAVFWWDKRNENFEESWGAANGIPARVIMGLAGKLDPNPDNPKKILLRPTLYEFWGYYIQHIEFKGDRGLFMKGTTAELQEALDRDRSRGIKSLAVMGDANLTVRFLRMKASPTKTVSIIGLGGQGTYWGPMDGYAWEAAPRLKAWAQLKTIYSTRWDRNAGNCSGISIKNLQELILETKGVDAWF